MEPIKMNAVINFAKPYRVAEGGTTNEGISINYLLTDSFRPFEDETIGAQGYKSSKASLPLSEADSLVAVPGYYQLTCNMTIGSNNQPVLKPIKVEFLNYIDLVMSSELSPAQSVQQPEPQLEVKPSEQLEPEQKSGESDGKPVKQSKK